MRRQSSTLKRWVVLGSVVVPASAVLSAGIHYVCHYAGLFTTMPWLICIFLAHYVFIDEVRKAETRKTAKGKWAGLIYFALYLIFLITVYGYIFAEIGLNDGAKAAQETHDVLTGMYFSIITWTTVGYGDVTAATPAARFFAALEALNGYVVLALFIAALVSVFQKLLQEPGDDSSGR
jgi:magnesium-transporting ATPase (P-type)